MSTGLIIAIVVIALILLALFAFVLPRARRKAQVKARERELEQRREHVAGEHRAEAEQRNRQAEMAEQKAQMAESEAKRERAEAEMREQRAQMHERGMADDELIDESERDRFAGTSADATARDEPAPMRKDERPMHEPASDYEQGRIDEARDEQAARFSRSPEAERTDDPSRTSR
jgi:FtsZ-interacting cell division protein ZipA